MAGGSGVFGQFLFLHHFQDGQGCRTSQVASPEGGPQHTVVGFDFRRNKQSSYGKTISHAFGHGDQGWGHPIVLVGKEFPGAAITALDFIEDQQGPVFFTQLFQSGQKTGCRNPDAPDALDPLHQYTCDVVFSEGPADRFQVVKGKNQGIVGQVHRSCDLRVIGERHCGRCAAMKSLPEGYEFLPAGHEGGQLDGILIGFGPRITEKKPVAGIAALASQQTGQLPLKRILYRVGIKTDLRQLTADPFYIMRMGVPDGDHRMPPVQIKVFHPFVIPYRTP